VEPRGFVLPQLPTVGPGSEAVEFRPYQYILLYLRFISVLYLRFVSVLHLRITSALLLDLFIVLLSGFFFSILVTNIWHEFLISCIQKSVSGQMQAACVVW
jgi:hypothetical protein